MLGEHERLSRKDYMGLFLIPRPMPYYRHTEHFGSLEICVYDLLLLSSGGGGIGMGG
jgi:hypothetical protein